MNNLKKFLVPTIGAIAAISLASCGNKHVGEPNNGITVNADGTYTVRVGNTNACAVLPTVFGPMDYGMRAYAWYYGQEVNGGKVKIDYQHLDDGYVPAVRQVNTDTLLNKNQCFGIVYSYEDQNALLDETNKVEVYTPLTLDYYHKKGGDSVASFPIQPIDYVEGEHLLASCFASAKKDGFGAKKVGVIAGTSSTGNDEVKSMREWAKANKKVENTDFFIYQMDNLASSDPAAAVKALKEAGVDALVITDASALFLTTIGAVVASNWENLTILASYKLSNAYYLSAAWALGVLRDNRSLYTTGWIAAGVQNEATIDEWGSYVEALTKYSKSQNDGLLTTVALEQEKGANGMPEVIQYLVDKYDWAKDGVSSYFYDSYAMAGYEGMYVFAEGLTELLKDNMLDGASTEDYVAQMEAHGMHIPMSTIDVSLAKGTRTGATAFTLVKVTDENHTLGEPGRDFKTTAQLS